MEANKLNLGFMGFGEAAYYYAKGFGRAGLTGMVAYSRAGAKAAPGDALSARASEAGVELVKSPRELCKRADLIIALTPGRNALAAARSARAHLRPRHVYVDASAASVRMMEKAGALLEGKAAFVDAAILGPVAIDGVKVLMLASGPGAARFHELLAPAGMNIQVIEGGPGAASAMKLIRSVFMKGLTGLLFETFELAQRRGVRDAVEADITRWIDERPFAQVVKRYICSTAVHAERRALEMDDALELLRMSGSSDRMTRATRACYVDIVKSGLPDRLNRREADSIAPVLEMLITLRPSPSTARPRLSSASPRTRRRSA